MTRNRRTAHSAIGPLLAAGLDRLFDDDALLRLAPYADVVRVQRGVALAVEGVKAHQFTAVIDGEVAVHRAGVAAVACGAGAWFGLDELIAGGCYHSTVVTTATSSTIVVVFGPPLRSALAARGRDRVASALPAFSPGFVGSGCAR